MSRRLLFEIVAWQVEVVLGIDLLHVEERRRVHDERMGRRLLGPRRHQGHLPAGLRPGHSASLHPIGQQHPLARGGLHHGHWHRHIHVLLRRHLQRRLHRGTPNHHMLGGTGHRLVARRTQDVRDQLVLEAIGAGLWILAGHAASIVDLVEALVGQGTTVANQTLHLAGQLVVDREGHVLGARGHKVGNQSGRRLDSVGARIMNH